MFLNKHTQYMKKLKKKNYHHQTGFEIAWTILHVRTSGHLRSWGWIRGMEHEKRSYIEEKEEKRRYVWASMCVAALLTNKLPTAMYQVPLKSRRNSRTRLECVRILIKLQSNEEKSDWNCFLTAKDYYKPAPCFFHFISYLKFVFVSFSLILSNNSLDCLSLPEPKLTNCIPSAFFRYLSSDSLWQGLHFLFYFFFSPTYSFFFLWLCLLAENKRVISFPTQCQKEKK